MVRVFIVEDHPLMRDMLLEFLALEEGIDVIGTAESAESALEHLDGASTDLVLIDMSLPGMSGIELLGQLRQRYPDMRFAMLSGHGERHYVEQAFAAGASGYILKGEPDDVPRAIYRVLEGGRYMSAELLPR
ncbi:MAG: response regulator transcription factor [Halomonas sp.]|nr:response regulator transcription factor [Halomonas sp.]